MMGATHALMGMLIAVTSELILPGSLFTAGLAAYIGGVFPDLDLAFKHRKTMHHPTLYTFAAAAMLGLTLAKPSQAAVAAAFFFSSAAIHSVIDVLGGGLETRPWKPSSDKGVYLHAKKKWLKPKRVIRWDGAPEDFILCALLGASTVFFYNGLLLQLAGATVLAGGFYMILRKKIVDWAPERFL